MSIRRAVFNGRIKPGMEEGFHAHWRNNLAPPWPAFPKLPEPRILRDVESDGPESRFSLSMAVKFAAREDIAAALASSTRRKSKAVSKRLLETFDGHVTHAVFEAEEFAPAAGLGGGGGRARARAVTLPRA